MRFFCLNRFLLFWKEIFAHDEDSEANIMKKLIYDGVVVSVRQPHQAWDVVRKLGQPSAVKGFREQEIRDIRGLDQQWECWTLSGDDIREIARRNGIAPNKITDEQLDEIACRFKKAMEWGCLDWDLWLQDIVQEELFG